MENIREEKSELLVNIDVPLPNLNEDEDKQLNYAQNPSVNNVCENVVEGLRGTCKSNLIIY